MEQFQPTTVEFRAPLGGAYRLWFGLDGKPFDVCFVQMLAVLGFSIGFVDREKGKPSKTAWVDATEKKADEPVADPDRVPSWFRHGEPVSSALVARVLDLDRFQPSELPYGMKQPEVWLARAAQEYGERDKEEVLKQKLIWSYLIQEPADDLDAALHVRISRGLYSVLSVWAAKRALNVNELVRALLDLLSQNEGDEGPIGRALKLLFEKVDAAIGARGVRFTRRGPDPFDRMFEKDPPPDLTELLPKVVKVRGPEDLVRKMTGLRRPKGTKKTKKAIFDRLKQQVDREAGRGKVKRKRITPAGSMEDVGTDDPEE